MQFKNFIAFDISKDTLFFEVRLFNQQVLNGEIKNTQSEISSFLKSLKKDHRLNFKESLVCVEATGVYGYPVICACTDLKLPTWVAHATDIKLSLGMQRGKSDPLDAKRICEYAFRFQDKAVLWEPPRKIINTLKNLLACRDRYIMTKNILKVPIEELKKFDKDEHFRPIIKSNEKLIKETDKALENIEYEIEKIIESDPKLKQLKESLETIPGVGPVISTTFIVKTNEFKNFNNAKKLACHCGVVPFDHSSGRKKARPKVSHRADKDLKTLLDLGARAAIKSNSDLADYYKRKIEEGKPPVLVRNNVRNKLVRRMFAVINKSITDEKYFN
jgi:transposase